MAHQDVLFPTSLAFGAVGGPRFSTSIVASQGGEESRNINWLTPRWQWEVGLVNKDRATTLTLLSFFRQVGGMRDTFNFVNYLPGQDAALVVARFGVDHLEITRVDLNLFSWPSITILEVRVRS